MIRDWSLRRRVSVVLSLLLSLILSALMLSVVFLFTVFNSGYMVSKAESSQYSGYMRDNIREELASGVMSGFDSTFYENVITENLVAADLKQEILRVYHPEREPFDKEAFTVYLYKTFLREAKNLEGDEISEENNNALIYLAEISTDIYYDNIHLWMANAVTPMLSNGKTICIVTAMLSLVLLAFTIWMMFRQNRAKRDRLRYMIYGVSAAFIAISIPAILLKLSGKINNIAIANRGLHRTIEVCSNEIINIVLLCCIFLVACVIVMAEMFRNSGHRITYWN